MLRTLILITLMLPTIALARPIADHSPSVFCESAIAAAERGANLPPRMMTAIALTESGRLDKTTGHVRPWPWTINAEGAGQFFATRDQAIAAVRALQARGVRSIDTGCMQVNLMHHPNAFASTEEAFDPQANARYAARFLTSLFSAHGHWHKAIGAYHSLTPARGSAYLDLVMARWQGPSLVGAGLNRSAYQSFGNASGVYGSFAGSGRAYGAFVAVGR
jgi:soluble lytic murein transglycosylase-like protein